MRCASFDSIKKARRFFSFRSWRSLSAIKLVNVNKTYIVDTQITNFVS